MRGKTATPRTHCRLSLTAYCCSNVNKEYALLHCVRKRDDSPHTSVVMRKHTPPISNDSESWRGGRGSLSSSLKRRITSFILDRARGAIKRQTSPSGRTSAFYISYELMMVRREVRTQGGLAFDKRVFRMMLMSLHIRSACARFAPQTMSACVP